MKTTQCGGGWEKRQDESLSAEDRAPFLLAPAGKDYLWGGRRLRDDFSKDLDLTPLAETWECSTHSDGESRIASGPHAGETLRALVGKNPALLGSHALANQTAPDQIPILVKLIDADRDLSVQVHPDDAYAKLHENGSLGKDEMWYVVDAREGAELVYGFTRDMTEGLVRQSLSSGTIGKYLQRVPVHRGDVFYIRAGTVHAIGAGVLVCEVQESSNLTYRLYDYDRVDKNGKKRPLQVDKALQVANLKSAAMPRQPLRVLHYHPGFASEFLCRCRYFEVERLLLNTERVRNLARLQAGATSFAVLLCTRGCGVLFDGDGKSLRIFRGDTVFFPAGGREVQLHGQAELLWIHC